MPSASEIRAAQQIYLGLISGGATPGIAAALVGSAYQETAFRVYGDANNRSGGNWGLWNVSTGMFDQWKNNGADVSSYFDQARAYAQSLKKGAPGTWAQMRAAGSDYSKVLDALGKNTDWNWGIRGNRDGYAAQFGKLMGVTSPASPYTPAGLGIAGVGNSGLNTPADITSNFSDLSAPFRGITPGIGFDTGSLGAPLNADLGSLYGHDQYYTPPVASPAGEGPAWFGGDTSLGAPLNADLGSLINLNPVPNEAGFSPADVYRADPYSNPAPAEAGFSPADVYRTGNAADTAASTLFNPVPNESGFSPADVYRFDQFNPAPDTAMSGFSPADSYQFDPAADTAASTLYNPAPPEAGFSPADTFQGGRDYLQEWQNAVTQFGYGGFEYDGNGNIIANPGLNDANVLPTQNDVYRWNGPSSDPSQYYPADQGPAAAAGNAADTAASTPAPADPWNTIYPSTALDPNILGFTPNGDPIYHNRGPLPFGMSQYGVPFETTNPFGGLAGVNPATRGGGLYGSGIGSTLTGGYGFGAGLGAGGWLRVRSDPRTVISARAMRDFT